MTAMSSWIFLKNNYYFGKYVKNNAYTIVAKLDHDVPNISRGPKLYFEKKEVGQNFNFVGLKYISKIILKSWKNTLFLKNMERHFCLVQNELAIHPRGPKLE